MGQKSLWMRVVVEKEAKNGLLQKDPWMGQHSLWMRVELCKRPLNGVIIPSNEGRGRKRD